MFRVLGLKYAKKSRCDRLLDFFHFFVVYIHTPRAATPLRICGNLRQRGLPLQMAKPLRQTGLSADLVKTWKILTIRQKNMRLQGGKGEEKKNLTNLDEN